MREDLFIGIDLGGTNIKGALVAWDGTVPAKKETATLANAGPEAVAGRIAGMIGELAEEAASVGKKVLGIGIGIPGLPDQDKGEVVFAPNLYWRNVPLVRYLRQSTNLPVFLENDANAAALGEQWLGAGRGSQNMIMITIGTGVGGGLIINGRLYSGASGSAGEIGHTVVDPEGLVCSCGRRGCLETMSSATAMTRMAREAMDRGRETILARIENLNARDIFQAAQAGDEAAREIIETAAFYLGLGLGNLVNIFNPDTIIVGGGVARAGDILFNPLRRQTLAWSLESSAAAVKIIPAELGNDAGFFGAARLVMERIG